MKKLALSFVLALTTPLVADTNNAFEGRAVCAKCELHAADECQAVLQITGADGKKLSYFTEESPKAKELHSEICRGGKTAIVQGRLGEKDGKKTIDVTSYQIK